MLNLIKITNSFKLSRRLFIFFIGFIALNSTATSDEEINVRRELMKFEYNIGTTDQDIHNYLVKLRELEGIEFLVFIYDIDDDFRNFSSEVTALTDQYDKSVSIHLSNLLNLPQQKAQREELDVEIRATLEHLQEHISWYDDASVKANLLEHKNKAYQLFGPAQEGNIIELSKLTENIFFSFARNSIAANPHQMWNVARNIGVKRFATETGIDLFKNSPERQKQRHKERYPDSEVEPLIFGGPPSEVDYPHNYYVFKAEITYEQVFNVEDIELVQASKNIINRNLLALNMLASKALQNDIKEALSDHKQAMDKFQALAGERFDIKDWENPPEVKETWQHLAQDWSVKKHKIMRTRFQAMLNITDAKADYDWEAINEELGFKSVKNQ